MRGVGAAAASDEGFDAALEQYRHGLEAFVRGDATAVKALFSRRDDVTLANPFGPPQRGRANVERTIDRAGANFADGT